MQEIEADGSPIAARLPIFEEENPNEPVALTIARTITVFDGYFAAHRPDAVLLLGDRFEILRWLQRLRHGISPLRIFPAGM